MKRANIMLIMIVGLMLITGCAQKTIVPGQVENNGNSAGVETINPSGGSDQGTADSKTLVANVADVPPGTIKKFTYNSEPAILVNFNGDIKAYVNSCPHKLLQFDEKSLKDDKIVCPFHGNTFAAETGEYAGNVNGQNYGLAGLTMISIKIVDGNIYAQ